MQSASMELSASTQSRTATTQAELDKYLAILGENATPFARLAPREKAALLRACVPRLLAVSKDWVAAACKAKGLLMDTPASVSYTHLPTLGDPCRRKQAERNCPRHFVGLDTARLIRSGTNT